MHILPVDVNNNNKEKKQNYPILASSPLPFSPPRPPPPPPSSPLPISDVFRGYRLLNRILNRFHHRLAEQVSTKHEGIIIV